MGEVGEGESDRAVDEIVTVHEVPVAGGRGYTCSSGDGPDGDRVGVSGLREQFEGTLEEVPPEGLALAPGTPGPVAGRTSTSVTFGVDHAPSIPKIC